MGGGHYIDTSKGANSSNSHEKSGQYKFENYLMVLSNSNLAGKRLVILKSRQLANWAFKMPEPYSLSVQLIRVY
jgi:hypothetical protein